MKPHIIILLGLVGSIAWNSQGSEQVSLENKKFFSVSRAASHITIDGHGDESAWKNTEARSLDNFGRDEKPSDRQSSLFRMLWDEDNLYVLFECTDQFITARETERDGQPYFDDCAEIFLIPAPAALDMHFGFEINLYKASNDFIYLHDFYKGANTVIKSYNPEFEVAVSIDGTLNDNSDQDRSWTMEIAIPRKLFDGNPSFTPIKPGNRWTFQAIRQDRNDPEGDRRSWSTLYPVNPVNSNVHDSNDFGLLEFVE